MDSIMEDNKIKITEAQLIHRSLYELLIGALYYEYQKQCTAYYITLSKEEREKIKQVSSLLNDLYNAYKSISNQYTEVDSYDGLTKLALTFYIDEMLIQIINILKYEKTIAIPAEYKDDLFLVYFKDKMNIEFY